MDENSEYGYNIFNNNYSLPLNEEAGRTKEQILLVATMSFAKNGFAAVSMRDIAKLLGIQPSSLYNHFESKDALWQASLDHAATLYKIYFKHLEEALSSAGTFEEVVEGIFHEPKRLVNAFTSFAFCMVQSEQFHDRQAGKLFEELFLTYSIDFIKGWFDTCVAKGLVRPFDTRTVATLVMHTVLVGLQIEVHFRLEHANAHPYTPQKMFADVQRFILWAVSSERDAPAAE
jgi:AcrR family transcriptional regulator